MVSGIFPRIICNKCAEILSNLCSYLQVIQNIVCLMSILHSCLKLIWLISFNASLFIINTLRVYHVYKYSTNHQALVFC